MRVSSGTLGSVLVATLLGACESLSSQLRPVVSDSAGIVVATLPALPSINDANFLWDIDTVREIHLDRGAFDAPLVYRPQNMARFPDGTIVVNDQSGDFRIAVIDADRDSVLARFAPNGGGSGEIQGFASIWPGTASTLWVMDFGNARLSHFRLDGTLESERSMVSSAGAVINQKIRTHRPATLFVHRAFASPVPDTRAFLDSLLYLDEGTATYRAVTMLPRQPGPIPYKDLSPRTVFAPFPSGIVTGTTHSNEFIVQDETGRTMRSIRLPITLRESSVADIPAYLEDMRSVLELRSVPPAQVEFHPTYPLAYDLFTVNDSTFALLMTGRHHPAEDPPMELGDPVMRLFTLDGRYRGAIDLPAGFYPLWMADNRALGTTSDSTGSQAILELLFREPTSTR